MIEIGKYANLEIVKEVDFGVYLDGGPFGEILLPKSNVSDSMEVGDEIKVFIYTDSEDRIIATTHKPHATTGEFAYLKAKDEVILEPSWIGEFTKIYLFLLGNNDLP